MEIGIIVAFVAFLGILHLGIKKEWNRFLFVMTILALIPSSIFTIVFLIKGNSEVGLFFSGIITFILLILFFRVLGQSRCPHCKKYFKAKKTNDELIQHGDTFYENDKAYQKNLYRKDYICKNCQHEWSKNVSRKEEV